MANGGHNEYAMARIGEIFCHHLITSGLPTSSGLVNNMSNFLDKET
jgi:hypothetical protein